METKRTESRLGRFAYLLKGGAKPRRSFALMMALVLVGMLSLAGVVSADNYWLGTPPVTGPHGTVNGGVDVKFADTWKTDNPANNDNTTATFTGLTTSNIKFARLYVMVYTGNMTENWTGTETITLVPSGGTPVVLANAQPLALEYARETGTNRTTPGGNFLELNRVTSDYISVFDVKDNITASEMTVYINTTYGSSSRFDGRVKEAKLVYGWDVDSGSTGCTEYWINEGHDPVTKNLANPYTANSTTFGGVSHATNYTATLYVDYSATKLGNGTYTWNGVNIAKGSSYPPTITSGYYAGINTWTWNDLSSGPGLASGNNVLTYYKTNDWYKIPLAVLTVKNTGNIYDFSGNYAGTPGTNEWAYGNQISTNTPTSGTTLPSTSITNENGIKYLNDGSVTTITSSTDEYYAAKYLDYIISESVSSIGSATLTLRVKGTHDDPSSTQGFDVWVWNQRTNAWNSKYSTTSDDYVTPSIALDPVSDYVDSTGHVKVLIIQKSAQYRVTDPEEITYRSYIYNDYDKLVIVDP
ncbi:MAG: DUF3344 domain-containing protein [Methanoregula sp.]|nr:DUF3344 domain-containing protein [Methanoregula sp.]